MIKVNIRFFGLSPEYTEEIKNCILMYSRRDHIYDVSWNSNPSEHLKNEKNVQWVYICVPEFEINGIDGIEFAENIRNRNSLAIILFLSSNMLSAVKILERYICPAGYFLLTEINRAAEHLNNILTMDLKPGRREDLSITVVSEYRRITLMLGKVIYFMSCNKKIICYLDDGKCIEFYGTLAEYERKYEGIFIRCHSGYLINRKKIIDINYTKKYIELYGSSEKIPISRKYSPCVKTYMLSDKSLYEA